MAQTGPKRVIDSDDAARIQEMLDRGLNQREIATALGISQASVSRVAARERKRALSADSATWPEIASNPESWLALQPGSLMALQRIQVAWVTVCAVSGQELADRVAERERVVAAWQEYPWHSDNA